MILTEHKIVDEISNIPFEGNIIPNTWYCHIKKPNQIADFLAVNILSDLIWWHTASKVEYEGLIEWNKKFKTDHYQIEYEFWIEKFGATKRQLQNSIQLLVFLGIIKRDEIKTEQSFIIRLEPIPKVIKYINIPVSEKHIPLYLKIFSL